MENLNIPYFLPGDKVVVIKCQNPDHILPELNKEVVTIKHKCSFGSCDHYYINEYPFNVYGHNQSFHYTHLRKVQEQKMKQVSFEKLMEECPVGVN